MRVLARILPSVVVLASLLLGAASARSAPDPGAACERTASQALKSCVRAVGGAERGCYKKTGAACAAGEKRVANALARVERDLGRRCADAAAIGGAGFAAALTPAGLVARVQEACTSAVASLAARSYGGPHAAVLAGATSSDASCLDRSFTQGRSVIDHGFHQQSACVRNAHLGRSCDPVTVAARIASREARAQSSIAARCPDLKSLITIDPATFVARASAQARCLVATAHGQTAPLALDCGTRGAVPVPPRATNTQVILDGATWGSRCGNGSDYAFRIRLAPAGSPVENVVVFMQGGGVCILGADCSTTSPGLFDAQGDALPTGGIMSSTAATNPFRDWTKVFLPYCTQDVHAGGGVTNVFNQITVHRYGALNVRAALRYVRDVLWAEMDANDPEGYRPDRLRVVFSGSSAGGYGAAYNYHWVLDDLGWAHTASVPDASLAMDNGGSNGVIGLGVLFALDVTPGWGTTPYLAPYCTSVDCAEIFVNLAAAHAPRLKAVPEQQMLLVSNQVDNTQRSTTNFASTQAFVNTARASYCAIQGTDGVRSFLNASTTSIHGQITSSTLFDGSTAAGTVLRDWLGGAMSAPDSVQDRVDEGTLVAAFPGVLPFACALGSPSGAFVDGVSPGF